MRNYNIDGLQVALEKNKPERVIRTLWNEKQEGLAYEAKLKQLEESYKEEYPLTHLVTIEVPDGKGGLKSKEVSKNIQYLEYDSVISKQNNTDSTGKAGNGSEFLEYNFIGDVYDGEGNLKEEYQDLPTKPTLDFYIKNHIDGNDLLDIEPWQEPEFDTEAYLSFIIPLFKEQVQKLAVEKTQGFKKKLAGREVELVQEDNYQVKYNLAVEALANKDYSAFKLSSNLSKPHKTPKQIAEGIVAKGQFWKISKNDFVNLIETYREHATDTLDRVETLEQLDLALSLYDQAKGLGGNIEITSPEDLTTLLQELKASIEQVFSQINF